MCVFCVVVVVVRGEFLGCVFVGVDFFVESYFLVLFYLEGVGLVRGLIMFVLEWCWLKLKFVVFFFLKLLLLLYGFDVVLVMVFMLLWLELKLKMLLELVLVWVFLFWCFDVGFVLFVVVVGLLFEIDLNGVVRDFLECVLCNVSVFLVMNVMLVVVLEKWRLWFILCIIVYVFGFFFDCWLLYEFVF